MNMETGTSFITLMKEWEPIRELSSSKGNTNDSSEAPVFKDVLKNVVGQVYTTQKYSLQGTTQGNGLTGGVPPVRFSM